MPLYPEIEAGGFTRVDGTMQFYLRVNALLDRRMKVLDFGAGRGTFAEERVPARMALAILKGKVAEVVAVDVDEAVSLNRISDRQVKLEGHRLPFEDASFDLILADHVFEHLVEIEATSRELERVLRPGGWLCARTPYAYSLMAMASRCIPHRLQKRLLRRVQPWQRDDADVFAPYYRLNSFRDLKRHFPPGRWRDYSYTWSPEPAYTFGSNLVAAALAALQAIKRPFGGEVLMVFRQKAP